MNVCIFSGRAVADAEVRETSGGNRKARVRLAVDGASKDAPATFLNLVLWGNRADVAEKFIKKGKEITVRCHVAVSTYEKDGQKHTVTDFVVDQLMLHGSGKAKAPGDEEIPF